MTHENGRMLLSTQEVAGRYRVTTGAVSQWCRKGQLPGAVRIGRDWVIDAAPLDGFVPPSRGRPIGRPRKHRPAPEATP